MKLYIKHKDTEFIVKLKNTNRGQITVISIVLFQSDKIFLLNQNQQTFKSTLSDTTFCFIMHQGIFKTASV